VPSITASVGVGQTVDWYNSAMEEHYYYWGKYKLTNKTKHPLPALVLFYAEGKGIRTNQLP